MSDASLTNIRMVRPKGPKIFVGALAIAAVGFGAWWATRSPGPVGEREDPSRLLVVGEDADVAATLTQLGFDAQHGTFEALATEGATLPGGDGTQGIEAILHLADVRGIGYVALEEPSAYGIEGITVTGDSADVTAEHRWAVFSVGELGMPPKVTVGAPSELPLPPYVQVLRAAFGQDRLAGTLFSESQLPIDAVEVHRKIESAVDLHGAYVLLGGRVDKDVRARAETLVDDEQASPKPVVLAAALETTEVLALADGTVLSLRRGRRLDSPRDPEVSLQPGIELELWYHPPGSTELAQRQRCASLRGGVLPLDGNELATSPQGDVLMLDSGGGFELWTLDVAAGACAFTRKGIVPQPDVFEQSWGEPHASGRLLRVARPSEGPTARVWTAGTDRPQPLPLHGCTRVGEPVWLDDEHFAVSCTYEPPLEEPDDPYGDDPYDDDPYDDDSDGDDPDEDSLTELTEPTEPTEPPPPPLPAQSWIYLVQISNGHIVAIPGTVLGDHTEPYPLYAVPGNSGLDLLAVHPWGGKLLRLRSPTSASGLLKGAEAAFSELTLADTKAELAAAAAAAGTPTPTPPTEPDAAEVPLLRPAFVPAGAMVVMLPSEPFTVTTIEPGLEFEELVLSPDGTQIVYTADRGHEVQVMQLEGGTVTTVAKNPHATHRRPRFTADGRAVVFTSEFDGNGRFERVGQRATLGGS